MKITKWTLALVATITLTLLIGCASSGIPKGNEAVPSTVLDIPTPNGLAHGTFPKDTDLDSFDYTRSTVSSNGITTNVNVHVKGLKAVNNPLTVQAAMAGALQAQAASTAAQAAERTAWMQFLMWAGNKAGSAYGIPVTQIPTNAP